MQALALAMHAAAGDELDLSVVAVRRKTGASM